MQKQIASTVESSVVPPIGMGTRGGSDSESALDNASAGVTPLILTFNEDPNLARTLARLAWARETVVFDSFSTDETASIARANPSVRFVSRAFDSHLAQWTAAIAECRTDWVLALDADYVLSPELVKELRDWRPEPDIDAYFCRFRYCVQGYPLRGSLYPPRAVLFRKSRCHYFQDGHTQLLEVAGRTGWLDSVIYHDDRKPLGRWLSDQDRYARLEVEKLAGAEPGSLAWPDRVRRQVVAAPVLVFAYLLLRRGLILDGWPGCIYVCQRTIAELILSLRLAESRLLHGRSPLETK